MTKSICINCGATKRRPFNRCRSCGFNPNGDDVAMAKSLLLSDKYYRASEDRYLTCHELERAAAIIKAQGLYPYPNQELSELIAQKRELEESDPPSWTRIIVFAVVINILPILLLLWLAVKLLF